MRLFVAVGLPPDTTALIRDLPRPDLASLRWTTEDQWHVTLRFLGEVEEPALVIDALKEVPESLSTAGVDQVEAVLGAATAWFRGRRILHVPVNGLDELARAVATATLPWGEGSEDPPFAGHLTLARVRQRATGPANLAGTLISAEWTVDDFALISSTLGAGGSRYAVVARVPLGG
ncbi:MAG TPA: RNA 2',3'-cyclic phosphodiesterase [Acidimicrobiales bacterium]|nr:RNA 2',3'-cyclic phosphodiesterase [Acidimicrobiales bacterium]